MSNRSWPEKQIWANGSTAARRIAFMPCVSETFRPNTIRKSVLNTSRRELAQRVTGVGGARGALRTHDDRGAALGEHFGDCRVEEVEIEVVGVEVDDGITAGGEQAVSQRAAVVGVVAVLDAHLGQLGGNVVRDRKRAVGRAVLDDQTSNAIARSRTPVTTSFTEVARMSASLKAGITMESRTSVMVTRAWNR